MAVGEKSLETTKTEALACRSMQEAIAAPTVAMVCAANGVGATGVAVAAIIHTAMEYFAPNRRMSAGQIMFFSEEIMDRYKHESLSDVALFLRGCAASKYDDGEFYASIDVPRIMKWWTRYLEEKAEAMEIQGNRWEDEQGQAAADRIASMPVLIQAVKDVVEASNADRHERTLSARIERLRGHLPIMDDDQLRQAYKLYPTAGERSIILQEADRRGLVAKALDQIAKP